MSKHQTPVEVCEALIGKPDQLARICGINPKAPYGWRLPSKGRPAGDIPFAAHMRALLTFAAQNRIPLTADHLIWGAAEAEIAAILQARAADTAPEFAHKVAAE